ncbi:ATP-binding protein [Treponema succinifaciens]|uniref:ATP-binding protein n=1 Tax=Treponema succinifaciens TaxID=167 RepID=UPI003211D548
MPVQISVYKDKLYISNDCVFPANWTADTLMQKHRSLPHNPDIANTFFRAGFIESWGRSIEKICNLCKEYGIAEPEYTIHPNDIMMMFKANEPVKLVLAVIADNPNLSKEKIAEKIGMSRATVTRALAKLVEIGAIQRVGSDKSGHWEIVENGE